MNKHDWNLVNQKYAAIKQEKTDLMAEMKEDLDFYRKRIYQATKDIMKGTFSDNQRAIKASFLQYAELLIEYFKMEDIKELMSEQLETIVEEAEDEDPEEYIERTPEEITRQFLIEEKPSIIRIEDCFNVIKTKNDEFFAPKRKKEITITPSFNLRQDKFREKGVKKKNIGQNKNDDSIYGKENKKDEDINQEDTQST